MVRIYAVNTESGLSKSAYNFLMGICSKEKAEKIKLKKNERDRNLSIIGNALAKYALKDVFGIPVKNQIFGVSESGKPYLLGKFNAYFNISHSGSLVVCAVSDKPVGIDIQKKVRFSKKTAQYIGIDEEISEDTFFTLWTKKEAEIKRIGGGIFSSDIKNIDISRVSSLKYEDYYISVAL